MIHKNAIRNNRMYMPKASLAISTLKYKQSPKKQCWQQQQKTATQYLFNNEPVLDIEMWPESRALKMFGGGTEMTTWFHEILTTCQRVHTQMSFKSMPQQRWAT